MNAAEFANKWKGSTRGERAAAHEHFINLCQLLQQPTPNDDPTGEQYAFEKGASKVDGSDGWADVWKRHHFAWEYKGKHKNLEAAYAQLLLYREALENPPMLVVCDLDRFEIHTNYTNTVKEVHAFSLQDFLDEPQRPLRLLRAVMESPAELRPHASREELTEKAAGHFANLAVALRVRGYDPERVAHFLNKLIFCMFAEDSGLLPKGLLTRVAEMRLGLFLDTSSIRDAMGELFGTMSGGGGRFGADTIQWFNGGLFDGNDAIELTVDELKVVSEVAHLDWSQIEPAVLGTLFERGLDPGKRSQLGAHYTDRRSIERVVYPVVIGPLEREFGEVREAAMKALEGVSLTGFVHGDALRQRTNATKRASQYVTAFLERLAAVRILDPACGSGNFLYVVLQALKDLERRVLLWEVTDLGARAMRFPAIGPQNVCGIELNLYAAELARVAIWIGEIQWMLGNGFAYLTNPVLRPLDNIECRDAVLTYGADGATEPSWPDAEFIIGNPPFVGNKSMRKDLGDDYVEDLRDVWRGRLAGEVEFVCYWFEKARRMIEQGRCKRAGLLATQSIRAGANRGVLLHIKESGDIFMAWDDEPWVVEGAAVRVSIIGFDDGGESVRILDGRPVSWINADLTTGLDLTVARPLNINRGIAFQGPVKVGAFDIPRDIAEQMLVSPNPDGRSNAAVVAPLVNGEDVTGRPRNMWIIDFGELDQRDAALYEAPFEYVKRWVQPVRSENRDRQRRENWWRLGRSGGDWRAAVKLLSRFIVTPRVAKHRVYVWVPSNTVPDSRVVAFARDDDYFFGLLHAHAHELWAFATGSQHGAGATLTYTPGATLLTFPFPLPTAAQKHAIASAGKRLDTWRNGWLNPGDVPDLKDRTLTNLYNIRPTWLRDAHAKLDDAVYDAYGWESGITDDEILERLLALNSERAEDSP